MSKNTLAEATSPYLLQHKDNPVHWRQWGKDALAEAEATGKPILLSVGYAACHWCHVMAHESFEDEAIAMQMNRDFICIKVDREEHPELDAIYQTALSLMGQQGGWPLTMFLTPEGAPFAGGTYFPPEDRGGRTGFPTVLASIAKAYREQPEQVTKNTAAIQQRLDELWATDRTKGLDPRILDHAARRLTQSVDLFHGGMDGAPKFPNTAIFELIFRAYLRNGSAPLLQAVTTTLDHMAQGGIYDHLGGGFARYSVDEYWIVPHFEKMLYDNALLVALMTKVWQHTRSPLYRQRIEETLDWTIREMSTDGAFASALDADSEGEEGKFYVWTEAEIDEVLGKDRAANFKSVYDVRPEGNWEGKTILHRLRVPHYLAPDQEAILTGQRRQLLKARDARHRPGWDDKILTDWNGLMIEAMETAAAVFKKPEWHMAATRAFWTIADQMADGPDKLFHVRRNGRNAQPALADDYANMASAAVTLYENTRDPRYRDKARAWIKTLDREFWDSTSGGYFMRSKSADPLIARIKTAADGAVPNANGTILGVLARLHMLTGEPKDLKRAHDLARAFGAEAERAFGQTATLLNSYDRLINPVQIVIAATPGDLTIEPLMKVVTDMSLPNKVLLLIGPADKVPTGHPAEGKTMVKNRPTAYVCVGQTCSAPIWEAADLATALAATQAAPRPLTVQS